MSNVSCASSGHIATLSLRCYISMVIM